MMTEKEYDQLEEKYEEAKKMASFWENHAIDKLSRAIRAIEDLPYELLVKFDEDSKVIDKIVYALDDFEKLADNRFKFWINKANDIKDTLHSYEDYSSLAEDDDEPFEPVDYDADFGRSSYDNYDYVAMGMGV